MSKGLYCHTPVEVLLKIKWAHICS